MRANTHGQIVMIVLRRTLGAALAVAAMAIIVWASNALTSTHASSHGLLRLAWSARPERIEDCRERSPEELARLPQHMRQPLACEGVTAEYRLHVRMDGKSTVDRVVRGGGLRRDRRLYVFEELPIPTGAATIDVRFDRIGSNRPGAAVDSDRTTENENLRQRGEAVPPHLSFEQRLHVSAREVILVTYDSERRALTALGRALQNVQ